MNTANAEIRGSGKDALNRSAFCPLLDLKGHCIFAGASAPPRFRAVIWSMT